MTKEDKEYFFSVAMYDAQGKPLPKMYRYGEVVKLM